MECETTDVIICGCGPTGAMLSALLGQQGTRNVVLEKEKEITTDPRGIALDEDGIRSMQGIGLYPDIYSKIGSCMGYFNFIGGVHQDLTRKPFMKMNYHTTEGGTGHVGFVCHKQPALEASLRTAVERCHLSEIRVGMTVFRIREDSGWVYVDYRDASNREYRIRGKFLVGADGKTGYTRKCYLEPKGIKLEKVSNTSYEETWVALNWKISIPTPESHPDFPLWKLGFSPQEVYDLFFPKDFRFLCNPSRPAVCGRFGLLEDMLWRFEFVVQAGEDGNEMAKPHKIRQIVYPYITHPGSRYSLTDDVIYPEDCITVLRSRPFNFMARSCNQWYKNRVILCGDAAHVFPPFGGQGITSGFRDAWGLAWRLTLATRPDFGCYESLFRGWCAERKQQLDKSLAATIENGRFVTESNRFKIFIRDWILAFMQLFPRVRHWLEKGARRDGMFRYQAEQDFAFCPRSGGFLFPQVYCKKIYPSSSLEGSAVSFTDDVIFDSRARLFKLVILLQSSDDDYQLPYERLRKLEALSGGELSIDEATIFVHDTEASQQNLLESKRVYRIATGAEFAANEQLCGLRPPPMYYDACGMLKAAGGRRYVILRPDRYAFAACNSLLELEEAAVALGELVKAN